MAARLSPLVAAALLLSLTAACGGHAGSPTAGRRPGGTGTATTPSTLPTGPTTSTLPPGATTSTLPPGVTKSPWQGSLFTSGQAAAWPLDPHSSQFAADIVSDYQAHYGSVGVNTMPVYVVPEGARKVPLSVAPGCNNFLADTGPTVPLPKGLDLNGSPDNPLAVYQPSTGLDWELWRVSRDASGGLSACWAGRLDVYGSSGVFPSPYGLSATGISYLATVITQQDVASGHIDHAMALEIPRCNYYVYPADRGDCGSDPGQPAEGQWFRFAPGTTCPPQDCATSFARMVFQAGLSYGFVVTDQAGAVMLQAEQPSDWAAQGRSGTAPIRVSWARQTEYTVVSKLPWASLQAVDPPGGPSAP